MQTLCSTQFSNDCRGAQNAQNGPKCCVLSGLDIIRVLFGVAYTPSLSGLHRRVATKDLHITIIVYTWPDYRLFVGLARRLDIFMTGIGRLRGSH